MMRRLDHKMKMIRHRRNGKSLNAVPRCRQRKDGKKSLAVLSLLGQNDEEANKRRGSHPPSVGLISLDVPPAAGT